VCVSDGVQAMATQIKQYYGNITAENTIYGITPIVQTGNLHIAVYDLTDQLMYVSFMQRTNGTGPLYAYDRQFTQLQLNVLFAEPAPSA
jgi:isopenicillin-N N-acyltransferase-like protein